MQYASSRRTFLRQMAAAVAVPTVIPGRVLGARAPSRRIALGFIGVGDHGISRNLRGLLAQPDTQVVALCDVDAHHLARARQTVEEHAAAKGDGGGAKGLVLSRDFRDVTDRPDIDAVVVSTPDHWHVLPSLRAARAGKDVLCEKPLSLTVQEGRVLSDTIARTGRIFQTATENRSLAPYRRLVELVRNGRLGKVRSIHVELPSGHWTRPANREPEPPPPELDYDFWLGPAPEAPYCQARCHWNFRWILDYSGGMLTDWGAHMIDLAQWCLDRERTGPVQVEGTGVFPAAGLFNTATEFDLHYTYADGVTLRVSSNRPGIRVVGSAGTVWNTDWNAPLQADPVSILEERIGPEEWQPYTAPDEHRNFLDGVRSRKECYAPAEVGHRTISIAHIGHIALRLGRRLDWDPATERFRNDPAADAMLSRPMRRPWSLEV
ncbi:MAG: Gfo/Idh/MocA family oxidoreductase [Verrucomicrobiae bacterium]|nr:Gfo/Idh/MocA family oxidoreductase [Verrucomicrobiae bacterium]